jgi:metallo-beta-lactamase class B
MIKYFTFLIICFLVFGCSSTKVNQRSKSYKSDTLIIERVAGGVYQHVSFLDAGSFGRVQCNGMIVFNDGEAIIFDTPSDKNTSLELIHWVENNLESRIKAIIPTHFHEDCLGGLDEFHKLGIPSYANNLTIELAKANNKTAPQNGFDNLLELKVGDKKVLTEFFGEGHTKDNVVGYFTDEGILFGGCLIKEKGAGKGNLEDANTAEWSLTVAKLKEKHPDIKIVIPGHGELGGAGLLDYTIHLFEEK